MNEAILKDSQWKAVIPVISTHFQTSIYETTVIPNTTGLGSEINLLDMFNPSLLSDESIQRQMEHHLYPRRRGAPTTLLQLKHFIGDSNNIINILVKSIKDLARQHSTILTHKMEKRASRK